MSYVYRTAGPWGPGKGADLLPAEVDGNFWQAVQDIAAKAVQGVGISNFVVHGDQMTVVLTDHTLLGPYTLPVAHLNFRNFWQPSTQYYTNDIITEVGSTYIVLHNHISATTFDPNANDGHGNNYYGLLLQNPALQVPAGGAVGMFLRKASGADYVTAWETAALTDLTGISITAPLEGQILTYLHGIWANANLVAALHQLTDVNISTLSLTTGQVLEWNGNFWVNANPVTTLHGLSDVSITSPIVGQALTWAGGSPGFWHNTTITFALHNLSDVSLGSPIHANVPLIYDGLHGVWSQLNAADMLLQDLGNQSGAFAVDLTSYEFTRFAINGPSSPVFTWPNRPGQFVRRALEITNLGSFSLIWPTGIHWPGGVMPTVTIGTGAGATDVFVFYTHDAGTTVFGNTVGQNYILG